MLQYTPTLHAYGGDDGNTLSCTSSHHLGSVTLHMPGLPLPTPNTSRPCLLMCRTMVSGSRTMRWSCCPDAVGHGTVADGHAVFPCGVRTALHDGVMLFGRVLAEPPIGHGHHAGQRVVSRDAREAPLSMCILAWEGRT